MWSVSRQDPPLTHVALSLQADGGAGDSWGTMGDEGGAEGGFEDLQEPDEGALEGLGDMDDAGGFDLVSCWVLTLWVGLLQHKQSHRTMHFIAHQGSQKPRCLLCCFLSERCALILALIPCPLSPLSRVLGQHGNQPLPWPLELSHV